jgi:hypothetical protein
MLSLKRLYINALEMKAATKILGMFVCERNLQGTQILKLLKCRADV